MSEFAAYRDAFTTIAVERDDDGILEVTLHTAGGPWEWGGMTASSGRDLTAALRLIARDPGNRVVILTGTGDRFSGPPAAPRVPLGDVEHWDRVQAVGNHRFLDLLDFPGPVIACINGPAYRHAELPFTADIVLAADDALIEDSSHVANGLVPGDGIAVLLPLLMGSNRGRYFVLTGQAIRASEMKAMGIVNEVLARDALLPRARELARELRGVNTSALRATRRLLVAPLKASMSVDLPYGHVLESLAAIDASRTS